jgi:subtilisin family serine protease
MKFRNMIKNILFLFIVFYYLGLLAQKSESFHDYWLQIALEDTTEQHLSYMCKGDIFSIQQAVRLCSGQIGAQIGNIVTVRIPKIETNKFLTFKSQFEIEFWGYKLYLMNDAMRQNNNIDSVHLGRANLPHPFKGKNVVVGIIDSGIEIGHPDFQNIDGTTRIQFFWDMRLNNVPGKNPQPYNYGTEWTAQDINNNICTSNDLTAYAGHGTNVAGTAAGNGLALNKNAGAAPEADIIAVALNLSSTSWATLMVDAVDYIYKKADAMGKPCVVNASLGSYFGSHDGLDLPALAIKNLIKEKPGRSFVCSAGNAGDMRMHATLNAFGDSTFIYLKTNNSLFAGKSIFTEAWGSIGDLNNIQLRSGIDEHSISGGLELMQTKWISPANAASQQDSIYLLGVGKIADVYFNTQVYASNFRVQFIVINIDSSKYHYRLELKGQGKLDIYSHPFMGISELEYQPLPTAAQFAPMLRYSYPDTLQNMVSSFACLEEAITVGNYVNVSGYTDYYFNYQNTGFTAGELYVKSSRGPTRLGIIKPDLAASGEFTMTTAHFATVLGIINNQPFKVAPGGLHNRNGGTSTSAPVVAGSIALLFERCNKLAWNDVKSTLLQNTRKDGFTGNQLPNNSWGYGKLNTMQAIKSLHFTPTLNYSDNVNLCSGNIIQLSTTAPYQSFLWSNGYTNAQLPIQFEGVYSAIVKDQRGCIGFTDTAYVEILPNAPSIFIEGNQSSAYNRIDVYAVIQGNYEYQWTVEGGQILGTNNTHSIIVKWGENQWGKVTAEINKTGLCKSVDSIRVQLSPVGFADSIHSSTYLVYPNPSDKFLTIQNNKANTIYVQMSDMKGKMIYKEISNQNIRFNTQSLQPGIYFIQIRDNENSYFFKHLVNH